MSKELTWEKCISVGDEAIIKWYFPDETLMETMMNYCIFHVEGFINASGVKWIQDNLKRKLNVEKLKEVRDSLRSILLEYTEYHINRRRTVFNRLCDYLWNQCTVPEYSYMYKGKGHDGIGTKKDDILEIAETMPETYNKSKEKIRALIEKDDNRKAFNLLCRCVQAENFKNLDTGYFETLWQKESPELYKYLDDMIEKHSMNEFINNKTAWKYNNMLRG